MVKNNLNSNKGFTLIELLVVIAIIGVISSVVLASVNSARIKARDAVRKSDLEQIRTAFLFYHENFGDYMGSTSGCGSGGQGWFSYVGPGYPVAMSQCLVNAGALPTEIIDPSGARSGSLLGNEIFSYMKYNCDENEAQIFAKLESIPQSDTAVDGSCVPVLDTLYGMNYFISVK